MKLNKEKKDLNKVEWKIYNYIKERSMENKWTSQQELVDYLSTININICQRTLRKHINNIRTSETIQKIILTSYKYGYKLMNEEEQRDILIKRKTSILKSLKQINKDIKKYNMNGQTKITFSKYERDFIESLLNIEE